MAIKLFSIFAVFLFMQGTAHALDAAEQAEMVNAHNQYRAALGVAGLTWSDRLADMAQSYAEKLKNEQGCSLIHSNTSGVGENLYWASAIRYSTGETRIQNVTSQQVADAWGSEGSDYHYASNSCTSGKVCGHYTQMVWRNTTEVGCGKAVCGDNSQVWVCNYSPAGNYIGEKPY